MKTLGLINDGEIGKVEMWELKRETVETWNEQKDDRLLCESYAKKIKLRSQIVHKLYKII